MVALSSGVTHGKEIPRVAWTGSTFPYHQALGQAVPEDAHPHKLLHFCVLGSLLSVIYRLFAVSEALIFIIYLFYFDVKYCQLR